MPIIKKAGFMDGIIPTYEEIQLLREFKEVVDKEYSDSNHIPSKRVTYIRQNIQYIKQSKSLSNIFKLAEIHFNTASKHHSHYNKQILLPLWGIDFKTIYKHIRNAIKKSDKVPIKLSFLNSDTDWIFKEIHYSVDAPYTDDQIKLLILDEFDKERRKFERLKKKFESPESVEASRSRPRLPESVRIEVWRRDGGKCAKCGSRENLEYDHIVPVSKGGSNTTRNIELLCETCNRSKGSKIE